MKKNKTSKGKSQSAGLGAGKFMHELSILKEKLMTSDNFCEIQNYFFDCLAENDEFIIRSKRAKNSLLKQTISVVAEQVFQSKVTITHTMILKYPKAFFYHGTCFVEGRIAGMLFFEDIDMGLFSVQMKHPETSFVRFSMVMPESGSSTLISPYRSKMVH
jgi:hypothetical protein